MTMSFYLFALFGDLVLFVSIFLFNHQDYLTVKSRIAFRGLGATITRRVFLFCYDVVLRATVTIPFSNLPTRKRVVSLVLLAFSNLILCVTVVFMQIMPI